MAGSPKMEISPELLQAITTQLKAQLQSESTSQNSPTTQKAIQIGPYKLNLLPSNQSFRTKEPITQEQQVLIDYSWNARNKSQLTMALHALSYYFHHKNTTIPHKPLQTEQTQKPLAPEPPPTQLISFIRELEVENATLKMKLTTLEGVEKENIKMKKEIIRREKEEEEAWGAWKRFPHKIDEAKRSILELTVADYIDEQVFYQQAFRRMATRRSLFPGITFAAETYDDNDTLCKGFSYLTCNINLEEWRDVKIENVELSLRRLFQLGLIKRLYITAKKQLIKIPTEKLVLVLSGLMEQKNTTLECEFQTIPPAFGPEEISNAKSYVTIRRVAGITMVHTIINNEELIPEAQHSIEDQITQYRALIYNKPYVIPPEAELVGEDFDTKIFTRTYGPLRGTYQFSRLHTAHSKEVLYYHSIRAYYMTRQQGDIWRNPLEIEDSEDEDKDNRRPLVEEDRDDDSVTQLNLDNKMED